MRRPAGPRPVAGRTLARPAEAGHHADSRVDPGDTVWWHSDIIHAVEDHHKGSGYSNVIYIGAAPYCAKNAAYLERQKAAFLSGSSAPDFSAENFEVDFEGRALPGDLTDLGKRQMGLIAW